ncbi:hypothetical protein LPJ66_002748 [Kickxella alabastrina]|uniref:Uncharacterized protein n=1 Tax=Kickxella alabastrina TaxID=61397 RepID=A0ACC1IPL5_9FUNG|nr:hypothetical protein LPJ66_002748 [Kickxella alabastrina]
MSSRAIRKLLRERGVDELAESAARLEANARQNDDASGSDTNGTTKKGAKINMFDLLMGGDDEGSEKSDSDVESASEISHKNTKKNQALAATAAAIAVKPEDNEAHGDKKTEGGSSKKKNKNKSKSKGKAKGKQSATGNDGMSMAELDAHLEEIQAQHILSEVQSSELNVGESVQQKGKGGAIGVGLTEEQQRNRALLVVDAKHLDSQAEIKRMFGSAAVNDGGQQRGHGRRRMIQGSRLKRLTLAQPKATWPPMRASPGVEMRQMNSDDHSDRKMHEIIERDPTGGTWFALDHSARFRSIQVDFLSAVVTSNADAIAAIAYQHPYHVDALLQLSEILKQTGGDFGEAGELVERALYAFESGFAPRFSATNGSGRLDFRYVESRALFLALFRHMQFMSRRGCWRTAFEVNKVLLSLDPVQDPYGALMTLDFHALKSKQYEYVRQFVTDWSWSSAELPNWAFSRALAEFMLETGSASKSLSSKKGASSKVAAGYSVNLLIEAILVFPTAVPAILSKSNIDVDPVILTHPYFQDEHIPDSTELTHMQLVVQLFVERHGSLYRTPEVGRWLQEGLLLALERIARGDASTLQRKQAAQKRLCTYVIPENISRHVLVADLESIKAGLPEDIRTAESYAFDPLPPKDNTNVYDDVLGMRGVQGADRMPGAFVEIDGEMVDMGEFGDEGMNFIQRMLQQARNRLGGVLGADPEDPGTSDDEYDYGDNNEYVDEEDISE